MPDFSAFSNGISSVIPKFSTLKKRPHIFSTEKTFTYQPFSPELKSFDVQKVRKPFNIKSLLTIVGHSVTLVQDYIYDNSKRCFSVFLISAALVAAGFGIYKAAYRFINFTGAISLPSEDSLEVLNKLMASFALEGTVDYDESGKIFNSDSVSKVQEFTQPVTYQNYTVKSGDTISGIARKFGLTNISTLISVNDIGNVRQLAAGQKLKIPSIDGIVYTVKPGDTLDGIVKKNGIRLDALLDVNELYSETLTKGQQLFLPGASLDQKTLKTAMGDRFIIPIQAKFRWTSPYGWRIDPIANVRSFHTGTDMACPTGTPIVAAMSGKISTTGINRVYGNYVIIDHGNGYQTLYAHMSKIIVSKGQWISQGTRIGLVGSTGYSTGPHLHFTVYKNGKMIDPMTILK